MQHTSQLRRPYGLPATLRGGNCLRRLEVLLFLPDQQLLLFTQYGESVVNARPVLMNLPAGFHPHHGTPAVAVRDVTRLDISASRFNCCGVTCSQWYENGQRQTTRLTAVMHTVTLAEAEGGYLHQLHREGQLLGPDYRPLTLHTLPVHELAAAGVHETLVAGAHRQIGFRQAA